MKDKLIISDTWIRIMYEYSFVLDICVDIKKKYEIDDEKVEINKIKRLIQDVFKIRAPRLMIKDLHEIDAGGCIMIREGKVVGIYIDKKLVESGNMMNIYGCIAHEMRHVWQNKVGYEMTKQGEDFQEYALSKSEVDAEAFSGIFMALFFLQDGFWYDDNGNGFEREMVKEVANRVKKIEDDVIWKIVSFWKKHFSFSVEKCE